MMGCNTWKRCLGAMVLGGCILVSSSLSQAVQPKETENKSDPSTSQAIAQKTSEDSGLGTLGGLPHEILIHILNLVRENGEPQDIPNVTKSCKKLRDLVWKSRSAASFKGNLPGVDLKRYEGRLSNLADACFIGKDSKKILRALSSELTGLKKIDLSKALILPNDLELLLPFLPQSLEVLDLSRNKFASGMAKDLANALAKGNLPNLKVVNFFQSKVSDEDLKSLAPYVPTFESLNLKLTSIRHVQPLVDAFKNAPDAKLKRLYLAPNTVLDDEEMSQLIKVLPQGFEVISLSQKNLQRTLEALKNRPFYALKEFHLLYSTVSFETFKGLIEFLGKNSPGLESFSWNSSSSLGDAEMAFFAKAFQEGRFARLKKLDLRENQLSDRGFISLVESLPQSLQELDLGGNWISDPLSPEAEEALKKAKTNHPNLKVIFSRP